MSIRKEERREIKRKARKTVKRHYALLLILVVVAIFLGSEYSGGALFLHFTDSHLPSSSSSAAIEPAMRFDDPGSDVFRDIISGNVVEGIQLSDELQEEFADTGSGALGHTEGFLASAVSSVTSGHLYVKIIQSILTITQSPRASVIIFVILAVLGYTFMFALIREPYTVVVRRMFLECRTYEKVPFHHLFFLKHARRWIRGSLCVIWADFLYGLWFFTIAGAFIKRYSYYLVPFIVAENPDIRPREAVNLSRRMMDGHKMDCFLLELSFLGWLVLGFLTAGFLNVFYYGPYKMAAMAEYYARIRAQAIAADVAGTEMLDDHCLFDRADEDLLKKTYLDLEEERNKLDRSAIKLTGARKFFAENMAIWMGGLTSKEIYQEVANRKYRLEEDLEEAEGLSYPDRLNPRLRSLPLVDRFRTDFLRCYTIPNLCLMFFLFSMIGWIWEVILFIIQTGELVNRGSLYGPWVPIYGAGGALILVVMCRLRTRPLAEFFGIAILCGFVEYMTSWLMEETTGMRWWDYSNYFLNLDGRICAEGLFAFAVLGTLLVYFLGPFLDTLFMRLDNRLLIGITVLLAAGFISDVIYAHFHPHTGKGITDMGLTGEKTDPEPPAIQKEVRRPPAD